MSPQILESMQKKSKPDRIASVLAMTYEYRIGIQGNLLFGDKAETLETANESMHWWAYNRRYQINLTSLIVYPGSPDYYEAIETGLIVDREAYANNIPLQFNFSRMNDKNIEMLRFQLWVFANTLLNPAPLQKFELSDKQVPDRDSTYDIVWDCPNCGRSNDYLGVILPSDHSHSLRLTCRDCRSRWDIENKAYSVPDNSINDAACIAHLKKAEALFEKEKFKECHDTTNELLGIAPSFVPARLLMGKFYRRVGPPEHMLKSFGAALGIAPFNSERHNDFADALLEVGAYGAARMHYQQARILTPESERALAGIDFINSPDISDEQRSTYFVSWSDDPPPVQQKHAATG
jgi:tetratricopeptide (TPR) repeat protein